jgi:hypothetical protein
MNSLWALALLCVSPVETVGNITIVNRVPVACTQILGSPLLPVAVSPIQEMAYQATEEAVEPPRAKKATPAPKKKAKPATVKKRSGAGCKKGRWRDSRGRCGIWR